VGLAVAVAAAIILMFAPALQLKDEFCEPKYEPIESFTLLDVTYGAKVDGAVKVDVDYDKWVEDGCSQPFMPTANAIPANALFYFPDVELVEPWKQLEHATVTYEKVSVLNVDSVAILPILLVIIGVVVGGIPAILMNGRTSAFFAVGSSLAFLSAGALTFAVGAICNPVVDAVRFPSFFTTFPSSYVLGWGAVLGGALLFAAVALEAAAAFLNFFAVAKDLMSQNNH